MFRRCYLLVILLVVGGIELSFGSTLPVNTYPIRFGSPFYTGLSDSGRFHLGRYFLLSSSKRAVINLRQTVDLFSWEPQLYSPDLGTAGRETVISAMGQGADWTRALWRGRPLRDPRTGRATLELVHPASVGGAGFFDIGALESEIGKPTLVLEPVEVETQNPLTSLHHREGFYGFMPVEFVHARAVSIQYRLTLGGLFPRSTGRFLPKSGYGGQILWGEWDRRWSDHRKLSVAYQDGLHKVDSPYQTYRTDIFRNDLDVSYIDQISSADVAFRGYRAESTTKRGGWGDYGREIGGGIDVAFDGLHGNIRAARLDGWLPGGNGYDLTEVAVSVGGIGKMKGFQLGAAAGVEGYWLSRIRPTVALEVSRSIDTLTFLQLLLTQGVQSHSPEQSFARYGTGRFESPLDPILNLFNDLPARGNRLEPSLMRSILLEGTHIFPIGSIDVSVFAWNEINSAAWQVEGDSVVAYIPIEDRKLYGWKAGYELSRSYWRGGLKAVGLVRDFAAGDPLSAEPNLRIFGEAGWHRYFYEGKLETDLLLSSRYYASFHSPAERPNEPLGGKMPVDVRFTGRIARFTFYYGIHNLNSVHYQLVPGYQAMHKEEYWGVDWLLFD